MAVPRALVRRPGPHLAEGLVTHRERPRIDVPLAARQWDGYVAALAAAGWRPIEVPPADDCPDAVFVEDTMVIVAGTAVIARPGAPSRRDETAAAESAVAAAGLRVLRISEPGTLDGGDVLQVGTRVHVGLTGRTNAAGAEQLAVHLEPLGATVVLVPTTRVLHLKSAVTALPDGRVIGYPPLVDDPALFDRFLPVEEEAGSHVVLLGPDGDGREQLLISASAPRTVQRFAAMGLRPIPVDISEFEKLDGCVTCLSVLLDRSGADR